MLAVYARAPPKALSVQDGIRDEIGGEMQKYGDGRMKMLESLRHGRFLYRIAVVEVANTGCCALGKSVGFLYRAVRGNSANQRRGSIPSLDADG